MSDEFPNPTYESLRPWAQTALQIRSLDALIEHGTMPKASEASGIPYKSLKDAIYKIKLRAERQGWSPDHDFTNPVPDSFAVKRISNYYNTQGKPAGGWVISEPKREELMKVFREMAEALKEDIPKARPAKARKKQYSKDYLASYFIGDHHFGMYAWKDETGEDYDLNIAENLLRGAIDSLIRSSAPCDQALIAVLGDYFHADDSKGLTPGSGHVLDTDSRHAKVIRVGVKAIVGAVYSALAQHKIVHVRIIAGNHDPNAATFLAIALEHIFEKEPRVIVHNEATPRQYHEFGKVLIGLTHGDKEKNAQDLPGLMAIEKKDAWATTLHHYWWHGHLHSDMKFEKFGVTVEGVRILAPRDAWHKGKGYVAGRDMKCVLYHRKYGERIRHTASVNLIEDLLKEEMSAKEKDK